MGSVGIVCILQDGAMTKGFHDHLGEPYYRDAPLHPVQFREVTALTFYKAMLLDSTALYTIAETPEKMQIVTQMPPGVNCREWDWLMFAEYSGTTGTSPSSRYMAGRLDGRLPSREKTGSFKSSTPMLTTVFLFLTSGKKRKLKGSDVSPQMRSSTACTRPNNLPADFPL